MPGKPGSLRGPLLGGSASGAIVGKMGHAQGREHLRSILLVRRELAAIGLIERLLRNLRGCDLAVFTQEWRAFHDVLELAHVARPRIRVQRRERAFRQLGHR